MGLNIAGAIGGGATIAITIIAIDKYSKEMAKAQGSMQKVGTIMKASAVVGTLAFATMTVAALRFAASVKTTDPEILKLQKSLGTLKTMGDNMQLSFAKGMAPALNQLAENAKKGESGLNNLASAGGWLVGQFITGVDGLGQAFGFVAKNISKAAAEQKKFREFSCRIESHNIAYSALCHSINNFSTIH